MRVIQVLAGAARGGAETAFEDIVLALHDAGVRQKVVTRDNNKDRVKSLRNAGIEVDILPFGGFMDIYTPWKMKKIIADFKPQIVQTWMSRATQKTPNSPQPKSYLKVARLGGYYNLKYFKGTDYYIANTPDIREYLIREGVESSHAVTINNFAPLESVTTPLSKGDLNTPEDATVLLSLARYHPVKALDILISAAAQIPDAHVWLAGEGPQESELKKLAAELDIENRIHFLGWRNDRAALMKAADMCVFPSRFEPFGNVFVQAWAQKIPLICSKSQGPLQYIRDGEDALMFDIDNVSQLVEAVQKVRADKALADKLVEAGYRRFLEGFTRETVVSNYVNFYQDIIRKEGLS